MDTERVRYDQEGDALYLWATDPSSVDNIISEETGDEILIEKDADTGEIIGVTILHVSQRQDTETGIQLPTVTAA